MVRKKSAQSLRLLSCRRLVENLCNVWNSKTQQPDPNFKRKLRIVTEYLKLPSSFGELLLDELVSRRQLQTGHLLVLLDLGLRHLKLAKESCTLNVQDLLLYLPLDKLQNLQCIEIDLLHTKLPVDDIPLVTAMPLFPKLLELHVTNKYVTDNCVKQVMIHCPQLHTLNLRYCSLTDVSIDHICNCGKGQPTNNLLQRLDVLGTEITYHGAAKALRCLPSLRQLEFSKMLRLFSYLCANDDTEIGTDDTQNNITGTLELRTISLTCIRSCRGYRPHVPFAESIPKVLGFIAKTCPKLECLSITSDYQILPDVLLDLVLKCEQLHQLDIKFRSFRSFRTQFDSVLPALAICGDRLTKLTLCGFVTMDVSALANLAPNLTSLSITCNALRNEQDENDGDDDDIPRELHRLSLRSQHFAPPSAFRNLEELWLQDVDPNTLEQILCLADNVQELFLLDLPAFTDSLLYKIESHLGQVHRLAIHSCEGLTLEAVKFLLAIPHSLLEELKLDETDNRSRAELLTWTRKNNLDIRITWSH